MNRIIITGGAGFIGSHLVLRWIKDHPRCRVIPTVVLGGSDSPSDVKESYELGAHSYFVKPNSHDELLAMVKMIFQ